jgi:hypothetical protein
VCACTQGLEQAFTFPDVPQEAQQQQQQRTTGERPGRRRTTAGATAMAIDITEKDDCYDMKMDMPGKGNQINDLSGTLSFVLVGTTISVKLLYHNTDRSVHKALQELRVHYM